MKTVATTFFCKSIFGIITVMMVSGLLPGCALVGPALTVGGLAGIGPLSYLSTAYTVGEFTYEYAANDATPDEVIEHKLLSLASGDAFEMPEYMKANPAGPPVPSAASTVTAEGEAVDPAPLAKSREERIEELLAGRERQFERLRLRKQAFVETASNDLSLRCSTEDQQPCLYSASADSLSLD